MMQHTWPGATCLVVSFVNISLWSTVARCKAECAAEQSKASGMAFLSKARVWKAELTVRALAILAIGLLALSVCSAAEVQTVPLRCNEHGGVKGFVHRVLSPVHLSPFQSDGCDLKLKGRSRSGPLQIRAWCIPAAAQLLEDHEGRHKCVYDCGDGGRHKCVGVGYRLDDDEDTRRRELGTLLADYGKVVTGEACLNEFQINALLALDAKRSLDLAADAVKALDDLCCDVMVVFADIVHASGPEVLHSRDFTVVIEKVSTRQWEDAAVELENTEWCEDHPKRCEDNAARIRKGCSASVFWAEK